MRKYLQECVSKCKERGFVETITGRRRYLPAIKDNNLYARAHVSWVSGLFCFVGTPTSLPGPLVTAVRILRESNVFSFVCLSVHKRGPWNPAPTPTPTTWGHSTAPASGLFELVQLRSRNFKKVRETDFFPLIFVAAQYEL